jgi:hypothetical protein
MTHYHHLPGQEATSSAPLRVYNGSVSPKDSRRDITGGVEGNERLTAMTGALLLALFAAEGVTILSMRQLLTLHFFLGMLLIGPVLLKTGSTVYRFARYYTGAYEYRRKGPPSLAMRILAPLVILSSLAVIGSGILLGYAGTNDKPWLTLHTVTFVVWFTVTFLHATTYLGRLPQLLRGELPRQLCAQAAHVLAGRTARWLLLAASVLAGLVIAALTYHQAGVWLETHHLHVR